MVGEMDRTQDALQTAVQMELDGKIFYEKASQQSGSDLGRKLLHSLSLEEDFHRQRFEKIYLAIGDDKSWPEVEIPTDRGEQLRTLFAQASETVGTATTPVASELDAVRTAMAMENRSYDFYQDRARKARYEAERGFYESVAAEERVHHTLLLDYYEFLKDPAQWFTLKEHPSLD